MYTFSYKEGIPRICNNCPHEKEVMFSIGPDESWLSMLSVFFDFLMASGYHIDLALKEKLLESFDEVINDYQGYP